MAHLRKRNGHLLKSSAAHLAKECGTTCGTSGSPPAAWQITFNGVSICPMHHNCSTQCASIGAEPPCDLCNVCTLTETFSLGSHCVTNAASVGGHGAQPCWWVQNRAQGYGFASSGNTGLIEECVGCCTWAGVVTAMQDHCPDPDTGENNGWYGCADYLLSLSIYNGHATLQFGTSASALTFSADNVFDLTQSHTLYPTHGEGFDGCTPPQTGCIHTCKGIDADESSSVTITPLSSPCPPSYGCGCDGVSRCFYTWEVEWDCVNGFGTPTLVNTQCGEYPTSYVSKWRFKSATDQNVYTYEAFTVGGECTTSGDCTDSNGSPPPVPSNPPTLYCAEIVNCPWYLLLTVGGEEVCIERTSGDGFTGWSGHNAGNTVAATLVCNGEEQFELTVTGLSGGTEVWLSCPNTSFCPPLDPSKWTPQNETGASLTAIASQSGGCAFCNQPLPFTFTATDPDCGFTASLSFVMDTEGDASSWTDQTGGWSTIGDNGLEWYMAVYDPNVCDWCTWFFFASKTEFPDCPPNNPEDWVPATFQDCGEATLS